MSGKWNVLKNREFYKILLQFLFLLLLFFFFLELFLLPIKEKKILKQTCTQEVIAVQKLAGGILEMHPDLEKEVVSIIKMQNNSWQEKGEKILQKYGYYTENVLKLNQNYKILMKDYSRQIYQFILITVLLQIFSFICFFKIKKQQNKRIFLMIDNYLKGNYNFTELKKGLKTNIFNQLEDKLKQLGQQIAIKNQKIIEEKENIKVLITNISHQLKTPFSSLKTCFYLYLEADTLEEKEEFLMRSQLQLEKLEELIEVLLKLSKLETAMIMLHPKIEDLREILIEAVNGVFGKARKKEIEIVLEEFADIFLYLDRKWTVEAIVNVLDNAVKYSPSKSDIIIRVIPMINFIRVEIIDSGIGIKRKEYNQIFQRFYRGKEKEVQQAEGSGIGLYLTRLILEKQGGAILVKSVYGKGSTFILQLRKGERR